MQSPPLTINDLAGPVTVGSSFWTGKPTVMVGEQVATATGRRTFALPTIDGRIAQGTVSRVTPLNPFPTLEVAGVKHRTGPEIPLGLRICFAAPVLLIVGGLLGVVLGVACLALNSRIMVSQRSSGAKAGLMLSVVVAGFIVLEVLLALMFG